MTLATHVLIAHPLPPKDVFTECRRLLGADDRIATIESEYRGCRSITHQPGQGLSAHLSLIYAVDGPLPADGYHGGPAPVAVIEVTFDTGYAYKDEHGGCDELHRRLTSALGAWLDERGADWSAQDEYKGTWHHRTPCPIPA